MSDDEPEPVPRADRPDTWRRCLASGCTARVDPRDHKHRCPDHRADPTPRQTLLVASDGRRAADVETGDAL